MKTTYPLLANRLVYVIQGGGAAAPSYRVCASETDNTPGFLAEKIDSTLQVLNNKLGVSPGLFDNFNTSLGEVKLSQKELGIKFTEFQSNYQTFTSSFEQSARGFAMEVFNTEIDKFSLTLTNRFSSREQTADMIKDLVSNQVFDQYKNLISSNYSTTTQTAEMIIRLFMVLFFHLKV